MPPVPATPDDSHWMRMAIQLATDNVNRSHGGPFGAVIVRAGALVAGGANQVTSQNDPTAHAEVVAIRSACRQLNTFDLAGCTIYSSCEPCPMCLTAILWARCARLVFANTAADAAAAGFDDSYFYQQVRLPAEARALSSSNLLREEALASFQAWSAAQNKVGY